MYSGHRYCRPVSLVFRVMSVVSVVWHTVCYTAELPTEIVIQGKNLQC